MRIVTDFVGLVSHRFVSSYPYLLLSQRSNSYSEDALVDETS